ncbi:C2H2 type zinc-finger-domain-containing protein [Apiospora phragmitis]|uniref:C2H2 type zinc-finger-domain-containing protein n=1 Tax=Apiospora phragmitis TaxID=2905665 RepID=A0ABR1TUN9_9PEZI
MDTNIAGGSNGSSAVSKLGDENYARPDFVADRCLFCNKQLDDLEANRLHMQTAHGLFIPSQDRLLVDLETLFDYLHLVIFGYNECISCGTQRNTPLAAQQRESLHSLLFCSWEPTKNPSDMLGKNHCRFDIGGEGSEFADFYDFSDTESGSVDHEDEDATRSMTNVKGQATQADESSLRLPSGKIISSRPDNLSGPPRQRRNPRPAEASDHSSLGAPIDSDLQQQPDTASSLVESSGSPGKSALTRSEKRENAFTTQLANMRAGDRQALAHLPLPQQRSAIATSLKQLKKARQLERRYHIATERSGNRTLMKHFVADCPARPNG